MREFSDDFKRYYNEALLECLSWLFSERKPFGLVIKATDNFDKPLPPEIVGKHINVGFSGPMFDDCYFDSKEGAFYLVIGLNHERYEKFITGEDIIAMTDETFQGTLMIKPFKDEPSEFKEEVEKPREKRTAESLIKEAQETLGDAGRVSMAKMIQNNPDLVKAQNGTRSS